MVLGAANVDYFDCCRFWLFDQVQGINTDEGRGRYIYSHHNYVHPHLTRLFGRFQKQPRQLKNKYLIEFLICLFINPKMPSHKDVKNKHEQKLNKVNSQGQHEHALTQAVAALEIGADANTKKRDPSKDESDGGKAKQDNGKAKPEKIIAIADDHARQPVGKGHIGYYRCSRCRDKGYTLAYRTQTFDVPCRPCGGTGMIDTISSPYVSVIGSRVGSTCRSCRGRGRKTKTETIEYRKTCRCIIR